uniref:Uncharacterized protein n=1 Tax=Hyaloperonospora arabidopsidis (strain Emoy2) TaxID=559515 RepID=M4BKU3_HYAAE
MIGTIQGHISTPVIASNTLDGINGIIQLLNEAGSVAGTFDAKELFDCEHRGRGLDRHSADVFRSKWAAHLLYRMENKADLRGRGEGIKSGPLSTSVRAKEDAGSTT